LFYWRSRRWNPKSGSCKNCRYNLTGNISRRCSECGTAIPPGQAILGVSSVSTNPVIERNSTVDSP
jgi:hypothetical protein